MVVLLALLAFLSSLTSSFFTDYLHYLAPSIITVLNSHSTHLYTYMVRGSMGVVFRPNH